MNWPEDDKPARYDELIEPVIKALRFAYKMRRQNRDKDVPWDGLGIGPDQAATCPDFKDQLTAENLTYSEEDQGRDALEEIVGMALRLGMEQGRRITMSGYEVQGLKLKLNTARAVLAD